MSSISGCCIVQWFNNIPHKSLRVKLEKIGVVVGGGRGRRGGEERIEGGAGYEEDDGLTLCFKLEEVRVGSIKL